MSTLTAELSLIKPGSGDLVDPVGGAPSDLNTNFDTIDDAISRRTGLTSTVTVANTVTQTVLLAHTIKANTATAGRAWKIVCWGQASVTGTPTLLIKTRIGGVAGTLLDTITVTMGSGITSKPFRFEGELLCVTAGASATWGGSLQLLSEFGTAGAVAADVDVVATPAGPKQSTVDQDLVITVTWGTASASNTISAFGGYACREA